MITWRRYGLLCAAALATGGYGASAATLDNPISFASVNGQLNLIMTARPADVDFNGVETKGWVYDVCRRASASETSCLPGTEAAPYGGVWLRLQRNDTLHLRLVNQLPPVPDAKHCPENPDLGGNPTNLHTHGLIVEPHRSVGGMDPYGDYVFVEIRNPANSPACTSPQSASATTQAAPPHTHAAGHPDMDVAEGAVEYAINLVNHPPGVFWFHPHMHGLALNQVTSGLAGAITVGQPADECRGNAACQAEMAGSTERVLVLKDSEVLANGALKNQQDPTFCPPTPATGEAPRQGVCAGTSGTDFAGGH